MSALDNLKHELEHPAAGTCFIRPVDLALALAVIEAAQACVADESDHGDMMLPDLLESLRVSMTALTKD